MCVYKISKKSFQKGLPAFSTVLWNKWYGNIGDAVHWDFSALIKPYVKINLSP